MIRPDVVIIQEGDANVIMDGEGNNVTIDGRGNTIIGNGNTINGR